MLASVWGGRIVSESTLPSRINAARRAIGDSGGEQRLIRTTIGKGVRFVGAVREQHAAGEAAPASIIPRLSIVVLPFANFSNDPGLEYFADGITDDLTTDLSRISGSFVIARNTAFTFNGKSTDVQTIGRELGVRYVVEGSVRAVGDRVRINVQLNDAESGAHLWADRFDTDPADLAQAQYELLRRLALTLYFKLLETAGLRIARKRLLDVDPEDLFIYGWALFNRATTAASLQEAQRVFERVLEIDPFGRRKDRNWLCLGHQYSQLLEHLCSTRCGACSTVASPSTRARSEQRSRAGGARAATSTPESTGGIAN